MSPFDFDRTPNRVGSGSLKWDVPQDVLPLWVADMDFPTAPPVVEALGRRVRHGIFGYSILPDSWFASYQGWWGRRHDFALAQEWLLYSSGVVPAVSTAIEALSNPGDHVVVQTPGYNVFFNLVRDRGRKISENVLTQREQGYEIDFDDLETRLADPKTSVLVLCNPHNPVGQVWNRGTLGRLGDLCDRHGVKVISDEIHCDLVAPGHHYVPFASVSEACQRISVTCLSPSKAFNLAGLQTAAVVVPDQALRERMRFALNTGEHAEPNAFAVTATEAAWNEGEPWLEALISYLDGNRRISGEFIEAHVDGVKVHPSLATYLLWLDCRKITRPGLDLRDFLRDRAGLLISRGEDYGTGGQGFLRLNLACPRRTLVEALGRLQRGLRDYQNQER